MHVKFSVMIESHEHIRYGGSMGDDCEPGAQYCKPDPSCQSGLTEIRRVVKNDLWTLKIESASEILKQIVKMVMYNY